jgi:IS30 family transposase
MLHTKLRDDLAIQTYFADPYSSWQRGTNEYTNGLLRRYYPKRTDFRNLPQKELNDVVHQINNIPRKVLHYKTPREVFNEHLFKLLQIAY